MLRNKIKSLINLQSFRMRNSLSIRLLSYVLVCSFALAILITLIQLLITYQSNLTKIHNGIEQVETTFVEPLAQSLWNFDKEQIEVQSQRIMNLPYMQYVKVYEVVGNTEVAMTHQGIFQAKYDISAKFDLVHQKQVVGALFVAASLDQVYQQLLNDAFSIFINQIIKIMAVAISILLIIYYTVIRHINKIALYTRNIKLSSNNKNLVLDGRKANLSASNDELDELVYLLNKMQRRIVAELTDKEIAINELQQERDFSATIINSSSTIICCLDADFKIATINPAAVILTGYSQEELNQKNWLDIFVLSERQPELQEKLSENEPLDGIEIEMHDQMGEVNTLLWTFSAFYEGMDIKYLIGFGHDITQQKQVEQEILQLNDQLEEKVSKRTAALTASNAQMVQTVEQLKRTQQNLVESKKMASLGSLVAGVAHEINTPIGMSVATASSLQEEIAALNNHLQETELSRPYLNRFVEQSQDASKQLHSNLKRAAELISSFKQVAVDQSSESCYSFNLKENVEQVAISLKHKIKQSRTQVHIDCPETLSMYSFPGSFVQIYSNLIINSMIHGFNDWSGERHIFINIQLQESMLVIDYRDTGRGIAEDIADRIFDPFVTSKKGSGGSGLGTHIVYNIVSQLFKGTIEHVAEEQGAHFVMSIPYRASMNG
ncbi:histidine kinase [Psychromonas sp. B3M02]|uniref:ATP-binding protein n=1 Tax=Psychromonas sp. B3M02 TaxID=2267226 RepID=UPI000DEB31A5|nr:ATP-binding protein [Psychromonas sp. B3M02]RBW46862.1 histidine kinase [Psychromonas sp. B3M02]